jgi:DNA transposition AAA+ family ATPase
MENTAKIYNLKEDVATTTKAYLARTEMSITELAEKCGLSRTSISQYLAGKYGSNPENIEKVLIGFLRDSGATDDKADSRKAFKPASALSQTQDANNIIGVCQSCQEYMSLGVVVGRSGYGKTYALKHYASAAERVCYIECDDSMGSRDLVEGIEDAIGIPTTYGTISKRTKQIKKFFNTNKGYLLIIDEADKLLNKYTQKKMEILRSIFDQSDVGLIIAGEPKLEAMIKSYLPRFANRVDFYANLKGLSRKEVEQYLTGLNFQPAAMEEMIQRATNGQTGCFRLLDRTLKNIVRLLQELPDCQEVTLDIISKASRMMML